MEYVSLDDLHYLDDNPRIITEVNLNRLMDSMRKDSDYLICRPLLVNKRSGKYVVYAGNQRLAAARRLGLDKVPCVVDDLDEEVMRSRILKDNLSYGDWDFDMLLEEFNSSELLDMSLPDDFLKDFDKYFERKNAKARLNVLDSDESEDALLLPDDFLVSKSGGNGYREIKFRVSSEVYDATLDRIARIMDLNGIQSNGDLLFFMLDKVERF